MAVPDDLPTFAATPAFLKRDPKIDRGSKGGANGEEADDGAGWKGAKSLVGAHSAAKVAYYFPKGVGDYHFGERHPMKPHRLTLTNHLVAGYGLFEHMGVFQPRDATKEELETFHAPDYIDFLERVTPDNVRTFTSTLQRFNIGDDCPIFDGLFPFCKQYAGASMMAARKLNAGSADIAVNWSGGLHHAKKFEASGFCYVNDIVMAILELLRIHPRVLYIDIDIHHGDGVQEAFYQSNRVLTVSFHKYSADFFPGTGHIDECGHGLGKNFSLNVPLQDGIDNESYVTLFKAVMEPTISIFRPSAIVLQCGADSLGCDRLGCFNLSISAHGECVRYIKAFNIPLMVLGGGGYTMKNVARCWTYETSVLLADSCPPISNTLPSTPYDSQFSPDYRLHPNLTARVENLNTRKSLDRIRVGILERLRYMHGAPSVQMSQIPPSLAQWLAEEEEETEKGKRTTGRKEEAESTDDYFSPRAATKSITQGSGRKPVSALSSASMGSSKPGPATTPTSLSARTNMPPPAMPGRARMLGSTSSTSALAAAAVPVGKGGGGCEDMDTS